MWSLSRRYSKTRPFAARDGVHAPPFRLRRGLHQGGAGVHPPQGAQDLDARVVIVVRLDQGTWRAAGAGAFDHVANGELVVVPLLADTSLLISVFTNLRERMSGHGRLLPIVPDRCRGFRYRRLPPQSRHLPVQLERWRELRKYRASSVTTGGVRNRTTEMMLWGAMIGRV